MKSLDKNFVKTLVRSSEDTFFATFEENFVKTSMGSSEETLSARFPREPL